MADDGRALGPGRQVPEVHTHVGASAGKRAPVGRKGDGGDLATVAAELEALGPGGRIGKTDDLIVATGDEPASVGADGQARNLARVCGDLAQLGLRGRAPDANSGIAAG